MPYLTVACTFLAFGIYMVYMCGWYWRQGFFDTIKIFFKEDVVPLNADRLLFLMAPILVYLPALLSWIVLPFGVAALSGRYMYYVVQDLNIGLLLIIVDFSLVFVAIIMSGYASNNKYALVGAMREAAELLSYEVPMLMSLLCVALFAGCLNLTEIVQRQSMTWGILPLFPAFVILLVTAIAETNRPPFDLPEARTSCWAASSWSTAASASPCSTLPSTPTCSWSAPRSWSASSAAGRGRCSSGWTACG